MSPRSWKEFHSRPRRNRIQALDEGQAGGNEPRLGKTETDWKRVYWSQGTFRAFKATWVRSDTFWCFSVPFVKDLETCLSCVNPPR